MLALKTTFDPDAAGDLQVLVDLLLEDDGFAVEVSDGLFGVARGSVTNSDATIQTDAQTVRDLAFGDRRVDDAVASGALQLRGDGVTLQRLFDAFRPAS